MMESREEEMMSGAKCGQEGRRKERKDKYSTIAFYQQSYE
jgi:hypothetical protein